MKIVDPYQQLDAYHFWRVQSVNHPKGRRYEVRVNHDHHYYNATGRSVGAAVALVLSKIKAGFENSREHRRKVKHSQVPMLKLVGSD